MDLLESGDERGPRTVRAASPGLVAVAAVLVLLSALVALGPVERAATRVDLSVSLATASARAVGDAVRGELVLELRNGRDRTAELRRVALDVQGLRVERVEPQTARVAAGGTLAVRVGYLVPSCRDLVLPGALRLEVAAGGDAEVVRTPVVLAGAGVRLDACLSPATSAIALRPAGGEAVRVGAGAEGRVQVEVRASQPLRLLGLDVVVDGVRAVRRVLTGGRTITADEVVVLRLRFAVPDCALLGGAGELVLVIERGGGQEEVRLPLGRDGAGPAVELPVLLDACAGVSPG